MNLQCGACQQRNRVSDGLGAARIQCGRCGAAIVKPGLPDTERRDASPGPIGDSDGIGGQERVRSEVHPTVSRGERGRAEEADRIPATGPAVKESPTLSFGLAALFLVVGVTWAFLLPVSWPFAPVIGLIAASPMVVLGARRASQNRLPPQPTAPLPREPQMRRVPPEPDATVREPSAYCEICRRPLTNPDSQLKRVGMECIKTHGPRYRYVPNPAHVVWRAEVSSAEVELAAERARARVEHDRALAKYHRDLDSWASLMRAPENVERAACRQEARAISLAGLRGGALAMVAFGVASLVI